jgi:hypothetical protein
LHGVHGLGGQGGQRGPSAVRLGQGQFDVGGGEAAPCGVQALAAIRGVPRGQALVQVGRAEADEAGPHAVQHILAGELEGQPAQGQPLAQVGKAGVQPGAGLAAHVPVGQRHARLSGLVGGEPAQHLFRLMDGQVQQFLGMQGEILQPQRRQTGVPQVADQHGFRLSGPFQQALAHCGRQVGLEAIERPQLLDHPVQLAGRGGVDAVDQGDAVDVPAGRGAPSDFRERLGGLGLRLPGQRGVQVFVEDAALRVELPEPRLRQMAVDAGQALGGFQRLGEGEVLIAVQGVVVDEIEDGRLPRQQMIEVIDGFDQALADVGRGRG